MSRYTSESRGSAKAMEYPSHADNKDLFITSNDRVLHVGRGSEIAELSNHEEPHTRMVVHIIHALETFSRVLVGDTYVVIILLAHFRRFAS